MTNQQVRALSAVAIVLDNPSTENAKRDALQLVRDAFSNSEYVRREPYVCDFGNITEKDLKEIGLTPGPIQRIDYMEIGYLLKNEYGFMSVNVEDKDRLPVGQTPIFSRISGGEK